MRFDSFKSLTSLLEALGNLGYQVPFKDYEKDFKDKGFKLHIHCYNFDISISGSSIRLFTRDVYDNIFSIVGVRTKSSIEEQLLLLLYEYISYKPSINLVNKTTELITLLQEENNNGN